MKKIIMVLGPTATGKTHYAVALAEKFGGEIISADSRQVYRGLDIGSGKDLSEYTVPYHLIDIMEPGSEYSLADFLTDSSAAIDNVLERGKLPVVAGGTALYLHGLLSGYQLRGGAPDTGFREKLRAMDNETLRAELAALEPDCEILRKEPDNRIRIIRRIELARGGSPEGAKEPELPKDREYLVFGVLRSRKDVRERIELRLRERLEQGMLKEIEDLHAGGMSWERLEFLGLEYRYVALYLQGKISYDEMFVTLLAKIRQFAKRQDSWYRKLERDGFRIYWLKPENFEAEAVALTADFLAGKPLPEPEFRLSAVQES